MPQEIEQPQPQPKRGRGRPRIHPLTPAQIATAAASERTRERALDRKAIRAIAARDIADSQQPPIEVLLVTIPRAAEALQVCERTVHNLITAGHLPVVKILGSTRVYLDDLRSLAATGTTNIAA